MIPQIQTMVEPARANRFAADSPNATNADSAAAFQTVLTGQAADKRGATRGVNQSETASTPEPVPDPIQNLEKRTDPEPGPYQEPGLAETRMIDPETRVTEAQVLTSALADLSATPLATETLPGTDQVPHATALPYDIASLLVSAAPVTLAASLGSPTLASKTPALSAGDAPKQPSVPMGFGSGTTALEGQLAAAALLQSSVSEIPVPDGSTTVAGGAAMPDAAAPDQRGSRSAEAAMLLRATHQEMLAGAPVGKTDAAMAPSTDLVSTLETAALPSKPDAAHRVLSTVSAFVPENLDNPAPLLALTTPAQTGTQAAPETARRASLLHQGLAVPHTVAAAEVESEGRIAPQTSPHSTPSTEAAVLLRATDSAQAAPDFMASVLPGTADTPNSMLDRAVSLHADAHVALQAAPASSTPSGTSQATHPTAILAPATVPALVQVISQSGANTVELVLTPDDLGRLRFEVTQNGDQMRIHLTVERPETLDLLRRNAEQLLSEFRQAGFSGATLSFGQGGQGGQNQPPPTPDALPITPPETAARAARPQPSGGGLDLRL